MIRSVSVPQLVNGSGPCSPSSSIEEVFQEEEVGIYGKEGMMISFETDSGSCSGSEEGYVSFPSLRVQVNMEKSAYVFGFFV